MDLGRARGLVKNASQIYGAIPALQQSFRKVAGADCGAYVFSRYRHDENPRSRDLRTATFVNLGQALVEKSEYGRSPPESPLQ